MLILCSCVYMCLFCCCQRKTLNCLTQYFYQFIIVQGYNFDNSMVTFQSPLRPRFCLVFICVFILYCILLLMLSFIRKWFYILIWQIKKLIQNIDLISVILCHWLDSHETLYNAQCCFSCLLDKIFN